MKKRILSLIFTFCLIIPCMFLMTACGQDGQLTKAEWESAFEWKGKTNVHIYSEQINEEIMDNYADVKYDGVNIYCRQWDSENPESSLVETYFTKNGNVYTRIDVGAKDNQTLTINKQDYDGVFVSTYRNLLYDLSYEDFVYDENTNVYKNDENKLKVAFTFNNDLITKIVVTVINTDPGTVPFTRTTTITFESVEITLP